MEISENIRINMYRERLFPIQISTIMYRKVLFSIQISTNMYRKGQFPIQIRIIMYRKGQFSIQIRIIMYRKGVNPIYNITCTKVVYIKRLIHNFISLLCMNIFTVQPCST
jgi:hypothetical protein